MKTGFVCPDGQKIKFDDCFKQCRMPVRCIVSETVRRALAYRKPSHDKFSVTELIQPLRIMYLRKTCDYYISPLDGMFALLGTRVHAGVALGEGGNALLETPLSDDEMTGRSDMYEQHGDKYILLDTKVWGSYRVARALGLPQKPRKGKQPITQEPDIHDETLQINRYRIFYERLGFRVDEMYLQVIVRDGGTYLAKERGVTGLFYNIPVPRMDDEACIGFFREREGKLRLALEEKTIPPVCGEKERWEDMRCKSYCDVWEYCDYGREIRNGK